MADEKIKDEKELELILAKQQEIKNKILDAIREGKEQVDVDFYGEKTIVNVKLLESMDEYKEKHVFFTEDKSIYGVVLEDKKTKKKKIDIDLDEKKIHAKMDEYRRQEKKLEKDIKNHTVDSKDSNALQKEVEKGLKNGNVTEMEADREISESENMRMFIKRAWRIDANKIYRVKGKDPHDFKFVVKTNSKKYQQIDLSTSREGRNTSQSIWLMEDGKLKEKKVDSLLLRGRYGIATDIPESVTSQNTRSYLVTREPGGRYIAIAASQKRGVQRNTTNDSLQKSYGARARSVYELGDIIDAAEIAEQIYAFNKDGKLTTREAEMVKEFKIDKNMDDKEIFDAVTLVVELKDMGYECNEMKRILSARDKDEILKLAKEVDEHYKENDSSNSDKTKKVDEDIDEDIDEDFSLYNNPHDHDHTHKH